MWQLLKMSLNARDGVTHYITWSTREDGIRSKLLGVNFHNILQTFNIQVTRKTSIIMLVLWLSLPIRGFFLSGVLSLLSNWSWKNDFPQEKTEELTGFHLFLLSIMPWSQKKQSHIFELVLFYLQKDKIIVKCSTTVWWQEATLTYISTFSDFRIHISIKIDNRAVFICLIRKLIVKTCY